MTHRHRGVGVEEQHGGGLAHDVAAANHYRLLPRDGNVAALQDFDHSGGRAGDEPGTLRGQKADVDGMESVDIFGGIDGH